MTSECADIRARLAAYLNAEIAIMQPFGSGWETTIFEFAIETRSSSVPDLPIRSPLVLRVYDGTFADAKAAREGRTVFDLATTGYPVPRPYLLERNTGVIGDPFLIMDRVAGGPLFVAKSLPQAVKIFSLGFIAFVQAQVRLHRLPVGQTNPEENLLKNRQDGRKDHPQDNPAHHLPRLAEQPGAHSTSSASETAPLLDRLLGVVAERIAYAPLPGLADALASLRERAARYRIAPPAIVHMDYHPQNVIVRGMRVSGVVDWVSADRGDRHLDAATTSAILATSAMDHPRWMRDNPVGNTLRMLFAALYFPAYHALAPMELDRFRYGQAVAALFRLSTLGMMRARGPESVGYRSAAIANVTPDAIRLLSRYATRKSGVPATLES
jgi:aminoglycoside phosphotransferase (APT) family kinase protein